MNAGISVVPIDREIPLRKAAQTYSIDQAPQAFADLEAGRNARGVIVFDGG